MQRVASRSFYPSLVCCQKRRHGSKREQKCVGRAGPEGPRGSIGPTGPVGPTGRDVQTARIVVGNALVGDTTETCDFLDPGDGSGIEAALMAVGPTATNTDVFVKSGTYDVSSGAVALPLVIPPHLRFRGAAQSAPSTPPYSGTTFVLGPTQRTLLTVGTLSRVSDFTVIVPPAANGATGTTVIDLVGPSVRAEQIQLDFTGPAENASETLQSGFRVGIGGDIRFCGTRASSGYTTGTGDLVGFAVASSTRVLSCDAQGLDLGFFVIAENFELINCRAIDNRVASFAASSSTNGVLTGCRARRSDAGNCFELGGCLRVSITACDAEGDDGTNGIVVIDSTACSVQANVVHGHVVGPTGLAGIGIFVNDGSTENVIGPNTFEENTRNERFEALTFNQRVIPEFSDLTFSEGTFTTVARNGQTVLVDGASVTGATSTVFAPSATGEANIGDYFAVKEVSGTAPLASVVIDGNGNLIQDALGGGSIGATTSLSSAYQGGRWVLRPVPGATGALGSVWFVIPSP